VGAHPQRYRQRRRADDLRHGRGSGPYPGRPRSRAADNNLANVPREERYDRLADFIAEDLAATYDFVLVDLPGKEDNIAISGLYAVEDVIVAAPRRV